MEETWTLYPVSRLLLCAQVHMPQVKRVILAVERVGKASGVGITLLGLGQPVELVLSLSYSNTPLLKLSLC